MAAFPTTRWSLIRAADRPQAELALAWNDLVRAYRPAILAFFRRGALTREAEDLTQDFILRSMSEGWWSRAEPDVGSFRRFLLVLLKRYLSQQLQSGHRRFECADAGEDVSAEDDTPERHFDLQFLLCLTQIAVDGLRRDYAENGRADLFDALRRWLVEPPESGELIALGERLRVAPNTLAVQLKRLRARLQKAVRVALRELSVDPRRADMERDVLRDALPSPSAP